MTALQADKFLFLPANYYEQNLQKNLNKQTKKIQQTEDLLELHFNYD